LTQLIDEGKTIDQFLVRTLIDEDSHVLFSSFIKESVSNTTNQNRPLDISLIASSTTLRASEREIVRNLTGKGKSLVDIELTIAATLPMSSMLAEIWSLTDCADCTTNAVATSGELPSSATLSGSWRSLSPCRTRRRVLKI
jgi:hypothetical protein